MDEAIAKAGQLAKLGDDPGIRYLEPPLSLEDQIIEALASDHEDDGTAPTDALATLAGSPAREIARMVADLRAILDGPTIQVRCLECGPSASSVPAPRSDSGLLELIARWLA
jgi:protease-4